MYNMHMRLMLDEEYNIWTCIIQDGLVELMRFIIMVCSTLLDLCGRSLSGKFDGFRAFVARAFVAVFPLE